ncbi:MAG: glycine zipper family protein [Pseudomonadota bacterium]
MNNTYKYAIAGLAVLLGSGCANSGGSYTPIVDGAKTTAFDTDLAACQQLATERKYTNGDVKSEALLGALIGAISDGGEGAVAGALVGGGARSWDVREERKVIVISCMSNRGHNVVG